MTARLRLPAQPSSVAEARRHVSRVLAASGAPEPVVSTASLLASELATNALLHAGTPFTVEVALVGDRVRLEVSDTSPVPPRLRHHSATTTTGRGLRLVATVGAAWGVQAAADGKTIWCEIAVNGMDESADDAALAALYLGGG